MEDQKLVFLASLPSLVLCFQPRSTPFVWLLARTWIRKNTDCFAVYSRLILMFSFLKGCQQSGVKSSHVTRLLVSGIISHPTCKGNPNSGIQVVFACRISNVIKSRLYNQQSWALEFKIQLKESGIPLTIGIQTPRKCHVKRLESHGMERWCKTVLHGVMC